jgi:alpha-beta hydrolase superfamily lysophospholipase
VLLCGHSTGGLIASLYAHEAARRADVRGLWLNSPFFDWRVPDWRRPQIHLAAASGRFFPFLKNPERLPPDYHLALRQDWDFEERL